MPHSISQKQRLIGGNVDAMLQILWQKILSFHGSKITDMFQIAHRTAIVCMSDNKKCGKESILFSNSSRPGAQQVANDMRVEGSLLCASVFYQKGAVSGSGILLMSSENQSPAWSHAEPK